MAWEPGWLYLTMRETWWHRFPERPDLTSIGNILDEQGDEIFKDADSIAVEIDLDKDIMKKIFQYAEKYNKDVYALVSNMTIAVERRDFLRKTSCFVCNQQEAGILFSEDYENKTPQEMADILADRIKSARISRMVVTMGGEGAVYADSHGNRGFVPALKVDVVDTTGAGDAFFAGVCMGLTYGEDHGRSLQYWHTSGFYGHYYFGKHLPALYAGGIWNQTGSEINDTEGKRTWRAS